jgi:hypothetical protein
MSPFGGKADILAKLLTRGEGPRIAANIAMLLALLRERDLVFRTARSRALSAGEGIWR